MKIQLLVAFTFLSFGCLSQSAQDLNVTTSELVWSDQSCEKGAEAARADFANGHYNSYSYGFTATIPTSRDDGFEVFYKEYMRKTYSIDMEHRGCIVSEYSDCYSQTMEKMIKGKFGTTIFEKGRQEATRLFYKR